MGVNDYLCEDDDTHKISDRDYKAYKQDRKSGFPVPVPDGIYSQGGKDFD